MAKQVINVGTAANDKKGDSLRAAFQKVNTNFTELYTALGINADVDLNLGAFEFAGSTISTTDSSAIVIDQAVTVSSNLSVGGDIVPQTAHGGDLGSSTLPWRSLYVSNNTIYIGGTAVGIDANGNLTVNSSPVTGGGGGSTLVNSTKTVSLGSDGTLTVPAGGRISAASGYNLILGDGLLLGQGGSIFNVNEDGLYLGGQNSDAGTYIQIPGRTASENGESMLINHNWENASIDFSNYGGLWSFDSDGSLLIPGKIRVDEYLTRSNLTAYDQTSGYGLAGGPNAFSILQSAWPTANIDINVGAEITSPTFNTATVTSPVVEGPTSTWIIPIGTSNATAFTSTVNITYVVNKTWTFGNNGSITFPDATIQSTAWTGFSVAADDSTQRLISSGELVKFIGAGGITTASDAEGNITITGSVGNISNIQSESDVSIQVNLTDSTTRIWRFGEDGDTVFPTNISINYSGGNVQFPRIIADSGKAFSVQGQGSTGSAAMAWTVDPDAASQYAAVSVSRAGGDNLAKVVLQAQSDSGDAGTAKTWKFNETGTLTLPAGGVIAEGGGISGAIKLTPAGGANAYQALLIYPTGFAEGDHLHLTAGGGTTELYLGSDNHYVKLANDGFVIIKADDGVNSAVWGFAPDGTTSIPGDIKSNGNINIDINLTDSTLRRWQFGEDGNLTFPDGTNYAGKDITLPQTTNGTINKVSWNFSDIAVGSTTTSLEWNLLSTTFSDFLIGTSSAATPFYFNFDGSGQTLGAYDNGGIFGGGKLTFGSTAGNNAGDANAIELKATNGDVYLTSTESVKITVDASDSSARVWLFDPTGNLTFPDGTSQSTAWTGGGGSVSSLVNSTKTLSLGNDGSLTSNGALTIKTPDGIPTSVSNWVGGGGWNSPPYSNLATTGGTGTGLTVNVSAADGGYINIDYITIATAGTGYTAGDVITITNENSLSGTFTIGVAGTRDWIFDIYGQLTLPNNAVLRNTVNGAIAFGEGAGHQPQGATAISIGNDAGYYTQGADAVAIGRSAGEGYQGANAIAIGLFAGQNNQAANSIVLNATGVALEQTTANTFTVAPIRNISATSGVLQYDASTKEVSYSLNVTAETFNTDQITIVGNRISTTVTNANLELECNGTGGVVINTVAEATTASTARSVGYLGIPASAVTTTATLTIADAGEHIYLTTTGQTITIPANASVAYPVGTTLTFIAGPSATTATIAITTDTMYLAGTGTTGSRTLAAHGMATAVKVAATTWYINGTGLT